METKLSEENKKKFVSALRSGEYKQTTGRLYSGSLRQRISLCSIDQIPYILFVLVVILGVVLYFYQK
jgi:hypothetical protein